MSILNSMQKAIVKKDLRSITSNKRLMTTLMIVPLVLTLVLPTIFILVMYFVPDQMNNMDVLLGMLGPEVLQGDTTQVIIDLIVNQMMPIFFIIIPIMAASVMAASSFVGEKEKSTLETLLYCPLSLRQIFESKVLASFIMSMAVSLISFVVMMIVVELEMVLLFGVALVPDLSWAVTMLLVSPAISMIAISLIVRGSAKAQSMEESQQGAVFLVLPVIMVVVGQFTGILLISAWMLLALGVVLAVIAVLFLKKAFGRFSYEELLQ